MLDNTPYQPTKFRTKNWVEINDEECGTYNTNCQSKFKTSMLRSSLCDYSDVYVLVKGTITIAPVPPPAANTNNNDKEVLFKFCAPYTDCISEIKITQIGNAKYIDVIMPMHNLIEYSNNYSKTSVSLWQYYRDERALTNAGNLKKSHDGDNNNASFKFKQKITGKTADGGTKDVEIMVSLKKLSNFWRTLKMSLINCEIDLILTWSDKCVLFNDA